MQTRMITMLAASLLASISTAAMAQGSQNTNDRQQSQNTGNRWLSQQYGNDSNRQSGQMQGSNQGNWQGRQNRSGGSGNVNQYSQNTHWQQVPREIRQQLEDDGYSNIRIAPGSVLVTAQDQKGRDVTMLIGPRSVTTLTSLDAASSGNMSGSNNRGAMSRNNQSGGSNTVGSSRSGGGSANNDRSGSRNDDQSALDDSGDSSDNSASANSSNMRQ